MATAFHQCRFAISSLHTQIQWWFHRFRLLARDADVERHLTRRLCSASSLNLENLIVNFRDDKQRLACSAAVYFGESMGTFLNLFLFFSFSSFFISAG
jgi:hypothetical protein